MGINLNRAIITVMSALIILGCASSKSEDGGLTPTIYYKPTIKVDREKCSSNELKDLVSPKGKIMETLCEDDFKTCLMQGSCFVENEGKIRSYNYHSRIDGTIRFVQLDSKKCPYGYGARDNCLEPYFSVAADLEYYELGDVIFIPRVVGIEMPDGQIHDGYFVVRDKGGGIIGPARFDFFTGFYNHRHKDNVLASIGFGDPKNRYQFRKVTGSEAEAVRKRRGYPVVSSITREKNSEAYEKILAGTVGEDVGN